MQCSMFDTDSQAIHNTFKLQCVKLTAEKCDEYLQ